MGRKSKAKSVQSQRKTAGIPLGDPQSATPFSVSMPPGVRVPVSEMTALNLSSVWAAVRVITGAVSVLPLHVYRKLGSDDREAASEAIPAVQLARQPNRDMAPVTFWETLCAHVLTWGNCYAEIERNGIGDPIALWPVAPNLICPRRDDRTAELYYESWVLGRAERISPRDILHVPGLGFDGVQGYSVIGMARRSLGLAATAEEAGSSFFGEGMRPGGVLTFPGSMAELQKMNLEESVQKKHAGATRFGKALVLYGGLDYKTLGIPPSDAQFLQTREFQNEEVARWFNIPPHKLRDLRRATFSNIEHQGQEFVTDTLLYWLTKIAQEFGRKLLPDNIPGLYVEHTTDALLRGDTLSRYTAYGLGRQWGFLSPNDIRRRENMTKIEGGDVYHVPVNMARLGSEPVPGSASPKQAGDQGKVTPNKDAARGLAVAIAGELASYDASSLEAAVESGTVREWVSKNDKIGAWSWVAEVVQNRAVSLGHLLGCNAAPREIASAVEQSRRLDLRIVRSDVEAIAVARSWRDSVWHMAIVILDAAAGDLVDYVW